MTVWDNVYRKYFDTNARIFQQEGFVEGTIHDKSDLFYKYFVKDQVDYVGVGNRRRGKTNKEILNRSFNDYLLKNKIKINCNYRQFIANARAEYLSVSKYDKTQPNLDREAWNLSKEWTIRHFGPNKMSGSRVVTKDMAMREMDQSTSNGFPHNLKYANKRELIKDLRHYSIADDYFEMISKKQEDQEWVPIWQCQEKKELRPIEKIEENKVRTFTSSPLEHSVALNRMCLDMNNRFYASNNLTWSFVGANKYNCGFHKLHERLNKHPNAFELDESAYDSSLFLQAMADMVDIRFEFLAEEEKTMENYHRLSNLYQSIIHSVIITEDGEMFQKHTGNPSGSANTIVDNTIILFRIFAYAWIIIMRDETIKHKKFVDENLLNPDLFKRTVPEVIEQTGYGGFMSNVEAALNGDDNTFTVSDKCVGLFNATTIAKIWSSIGITTNTPNDAFGQKVKDVRFLSQGFTLHRGKYLPTPETNKVLSTLMYGSDHDDPRWHLLRANALRLDSWANIEVRKIIASYIEYLCSENKVLFSQKTTLHFGTAEVKMEDIIDMWRSDDWIFRLYSDYECTDNNKEVLTLYRLGCDSINCEKPLAAELQEDQTKEFGSKLNIKIKQSKLNTNKMQKKSSKKKGGSSILKNVEQVVIKNKSNRRARRRATFIGPRNAPRVKGQGAYSISDIVRPFTDNTKSVGIVNRGARSVGNWIGDQTGITGAGGVLGNASSWLARAFGFGSYKIKSNTLMTQNIAQFSNNGSIEFSHREFIGDINSTTGFVNSAYPINPGNNVLFPWLSTLAKNYEQYEMLGLIFEFKSTSASAVGSVNTGLGTVIMATDYDVLDGLYPSKRAMEIADFSTSGPPSVNQIHPVECDPKQNVMRQLFIQPGNSVAAYPDDARFSAVGNFQIATSGMQGISTIGELWVSYHIKLIKPQLDNTLSVSPAFSAHVGGQIASTGVAVILQKESTNNNAFSIVNVGNNIELTLNNAQLLGSYLITVIYTASNAALGSDVISNSTNGTFITSGGCSIITMKYNASGGYNSAPASLGASPAFIAPTWRNNFSGSLGTASSYAVLNVTAVPAVVSIPKIQSLTGGAFVFFDIYLAPFTVSFPTSIEKHNEVDEMRKMLDEMRIMYAKNTSKEEVKYGDEEEEYQTSRRHF